MVLTITAWAPLEAADAAISDRFRQFGGTRPGLIAVVRVVTDVAATIPYVTVGCLTALILWVRRHRRDAVFVAAVTVTVPVLWALMHLLLVHARPVGRVRGGGEQRLPERAHLQRHRGRTGGRGLALIRPRTAARRAVLVTSRRCCSPWSSACAG